MPRNERVQLIQQIEAARQSRVVTYICSDRLNAQALIGEDAVRVLRDLTRAIGHVPKLDLFIYSRGGAMEAPWPIICALRSCCDELAILVPFHAHSAATLIAIGCDKIVMGDKAQLGAIDPALRTTNRDGGIVTQDDVRVEDVMSFIDFLRTKAEIRDDKTIGEHTQMLAQKMGPWTLGSVYRTHSHIRAVARMMLEGHKKRLPSEKITRVISALAQETRSHGHAISRREARKLGLPVVDADQALDDLMWSLLAEYETASEMRNPLDPFGMLANNDEVAIDLKSAWLESTDAAWANQITGKIKRVRMSPAALEVKVSLAFNLNLVPPAGTDLVNVSPAVINAVQQAATAQLQAQIPQQLATVPDQVREQVRLHSPMKSIEFQLIGKWVDVTAGP